MLKIYGAPWWKTLSLLGGVFLTLWRELIQLIQCKLFGLGLLVMSNQSETVVWMRGAEPYPRKSLWTSDQLSEYPREILLGLQILPQIVLIPWTIQRTGLTVCRRLMQSFDYFEKTVRHFGNLRIVCSGEIGNR